MASTASGRFLPPDPRTTEPYRLTPGLALRIAVLGTLALGIFGVLFLRLWALQILSGTQYLQAAQSNQLRHVPLPAPRGAIVDADGNVLVTNKAGTAIELWPADLKKNRYIELRRLSGVIDVPLAQMAALLRKQQLIDPLAPVTVKEPASEAEVRYLLERARDFPGVQVGHSYLRRYPYGSLAAQVLGYVGEISPDELKADRQRGYRPGDIVGQAGVERQFDQYLRGRPGVATMRVDANGRPRSRLTARSQAVSGHTVRLTIDLELQQAAERALVYGIDLAQSQHMWAARGGAIVAIDPRDGSIRALASNPTYNPGVYVGQVTQKKLVAAGLLGQAASEAKNYPALDRAVYSAYPPGSTFKPVVALAGLQEGLITPYEQLQCTGSMTVDKHKFDNWDPYVNQPMALQEALARSCDTYFYQVGLRFYNNDISRGPALQKWAKTYGIGETTGLDIGGEQPGLLPTPEWRKKFFTKDWDRNWQVDRLWKSGDSVQLSIGQKDVAVTPLQMARFYALIANGGRLVTPHVVQQVEQPSSEGTTGSTLRRFTPPATPRADIDAASLESIRQGLYDATHASYGTSTATFGAFPVQIAGKTGTAEKVVHVPGDPNGYNIAQSWWCGYGPYASPELVVCALIENGGHGGTAAAPAALRVFEEYFHETALQAGTAATD